MNDVKMTLELLDKVPHEYKNIFILWIILCVGIRVFIKNIYPKYKITVIKREYYNVYSAWILVSCQIVGILVFYSMSLYVVSHIAIYMDRILGEMELSERDVNIIVFVLFGIVMFFTSLIYIWLYRILYRYIHSKMEKKASYLLKKNLLYAMGMYWGLMIFVLGNTLFFNNFINDNYFVILLMIATLIQMDKNVIKEEVRDIRYIIYTNDGKKYKSKEEPFIFQSWMYIKIYDKKRRIKEIVQINRNKVLKVRKKIKNKL